MKTVCGDDIFTRCFFFFCLFAEIEALHLAFAELRQTSHSTVAESEARASKAQRVRGLKKNGERGVEG